MNIETFSMPSGQKYSNDNTGSLRSRGVLHSHTMNGSFPVVVMLRLPSCVPKVMWLVRTGLSGNVIDVGWSAFKTFPQQKLCCIRMQNSTANQFVIGDGLTLAGHLIGNKYSTGGGKAVLNGDLMFQGRPLIEEADLTVIYSDTGEFLRGTGLVGGAETNIKFSDGENISANFKDGILDPEAEAIKQTILNIK